MAKNNKRLNKNTKIILKTLLGIGVLSVIVISPMILPAFGILIRESKKEQKSKLKPESFLNTFYQLKKRGLIKFEKRNNQIYIFLTEEGKKKAEKYRVDDLQIKRPDEWDKKWRIVIFDIGSCKKIVREALRGKLKELDFYQLQKSVWLHPFDCFKEIEFLKNFFDLNDKELRVIISTDIGGDREIREKYRI